MFRARNGHRPIQGGSVRTHRSGKLRLCDQQRTAHQNADRAILRFVPNGLYDPG
jgi:hypothetical protein